MIFDVPKLQEPIPQDIPFLGGLDEVTPSRKSNPGSLRRVQNVEIDINGGYITPTGYERFDGKAKPSSATYIILDVTITGSFSDGDTVTGDVTGDTGVIVAGGVVTSGVQDYLVLTKVVGSFNNPTEDLLVGGVQGNVDAVGVSDGAETNQLRAQFRNLAADVYRADIAGIPGDGDVLGIWMLDDVKYGWRNEASYGTVNLDSGGSGSVDGITVNSIEIMSGAENFDTSLAITAAAVAANINAFTSIPNYTASSVGALIKIRALVENVFTVVSSVTTITSTDVNMSGHGLTAEMYKNTASGWQYVPLGFELDFTSGGTTEIAEGQTITGLVSGATALVTRVALSTGTWAAGTAAGRFIFAVQTGTFQAEGVEVSGSGDLGTIAGNSSAITVLADGRYEHVTHNFNGSTGVDRIYACDRVNRGFEFDGTVYAPIDSTMDLDTPTHVWAHKSHLFFGFSSSAQHSGIGTPFVWTPLTGAAELAVGGVLTGFAEQPSDAPPTSGQSSSALTILTRNRVHTLYGSSSADWDLASFRREVGAYPHTVQEFGMTLMQDNRGVTSLETSQAFGNFQHSSVSRLVQTFMNSKKGLATASCIARDKSQYRLYFSDGTALYLTTENTKVVGLMPQLFSHTVKCAFSLETIAGDEEIFFGGADGMVYQMERGTSHDGDAIEVIGITHFAHSKHTRREKIYQDVSFEVGGTAYAQFDYTYELGYGTSDIPQPGVVTKETSFSAVFWDAFTWDAFTWDGQTLSPTQADLDGTATNVSHIFRSNSDYFSPITFSGLLQHFIWGVEQRG
jgi:hypothetical protein